MIGAVYSFPPICLPAKAMDAAKRARKGLDVCYCLKLLEATSISTLTGSGFSRKEGLEFVRCTRKYAESYIIEEKITGPRCYEN